MPNTIQSDRSLIQLFKTNKLPSIVLILGLAVIALSVANYYKGTLGNESTFPTLLAGSLTGGLASLIASGILIKSIIRGESKNTSENRKGERLSDEGAKAYEEVLKAADLKERTKAKQEAEAKKLKEQEDKFWQLVNTKNSFDDQETEGWEVVGG